ncbi:hypothetical protein ACF3NT_13515 [Naumannella halotolerans]|uniref:Small multidrug efflux protein n=1 Tax=Naumannella halotolerans TaxID=993414 RepID=A0A4R7J3C6_9ACTN|nr:hypothetical protein [Naumannella halotolerans]TDT30839.1 hypothetical protein CLV29_2245 [Naumannella halotolerans]
MIESIQQFMSTVPEIIQVLVVAGVGAIPFLESHGASALGVIAGLPLAVAIIVAAIGNFICTGLLVVGAGKARGSFDQKRVSTPRQLKIKKLVDRFGVPGVGLIGQMVVPNQFTAPALVGLGASTTKVLIWQGIGIIVWAIVFGILASLGVAVLA